MVSFSSPLLTDNPRHVVRMSFFFFRPIKRLPASIAYHS